MNTPTTRTKPGHMPRNTDKDFCSATKTTITFSPTICRPSSGPKSGSGSTKTTTSSSNEHRKALRHTSSSCPTTRQLRLLAIGKVSRLKRSPQLSPGDKKCPLIVSRGLTSSPTTSDHWTLRHWSFKRSTGA